MSEDTRFDEYDADVSLDPEDKARIGSNKLDWWKMTKGQTQLCSFLYFHPVDVTARKSLLIEAKASKRVATPEEIKAACQKALEAKAASLSPKEGPPKTVDQLTEDEKLDLTVAQFRSFQAHYNEGEPKGFVLSRLRLDGPEADAVWKRLPEPKPYFSTLLLLYPMNAEGKHDVEAVKKGQFRIMPWRFGKNVYDEIWNLNDGLRGNSMSIANQDIKLECKDTQYQNMKVNFVGKAMWQSAPNFRKMILTKAMEFYGKLVPFRAMSTDELRAKLGLTGSAVQDVAAGTDEFAGMLDNV